ncbi:hypothetical protein K490DRAFT_64007 [Saccharata proteae CBS 121410]|uniref:SWR1-complex protein 3 domain-containing protein n=1 Tax=Saccharata proteae CBS 121410 TaxID=1314787 RepID=A0A6A5YBB7_9PEZI|nr:hypothetical protein K490DRAFT_64007 [Saccharata proteae CBS 121410]
MVELRRKNPARGKPEPPKEEPTPKRQAVKEKATPAKERSASLSVVEKPALPTKVVPGQPIPTLSEPQPNNLSDAEWQTVAQSGVLKAAIERSRQRWTTPGLFELYYSKAGKKKTQGTGIEADQDVKAKQMKREGNCKFIIEPHIWDVTIWTMKDITAPPPPKPPKPPVQLPPPYYGAYNHPVTYQTYPPYGSPSVPAARPPPPPPPVAPAQRRPSVQLPPQPPAPPLQPPPPAPAAAQTPDPVIHMLAERANTDYKLRDIMKIVAKGDATKEQLEYFQAHINELTEKLEAQRKAKQRPPQPSKPSPAQRPPTAPQPPASSAPQPPAPSGPSTPSAPSTPQPFSNLAPQPPAQPAAQYYTPPIHPSPYTPHPAAPPLAVTAAQPPPPPPPQQSYRALCIDFNTNGDRLLFPRNTILEYLPGNAVLASFIIKQKVDALAVQSLPKNSNYTPLHDYWQPVTARFIADSPHMLNCLRRWVRPQEEVRKYMEEIMQTCERAGETEIAKRLPREGVKIEGLNGNGVAKVDGEGDVVMGDVTPAARVGTPATGERKRGVKRGR